MRHKPKKILELSEPNRYGFIVVYKDFMKCKTLNGNEKLMFIALKYFMKYGQDEDVIFPSIVKLRELTGWSKQKIISTLQSLQDKGIIKRKHRGCNQSNTYTIVDNPAMWLAETVDEMKQIGDSTIPYSSEAMVEELIRRGVLTKKELVSQTGQSSDTSSKKQSGSDSETLGVVSKPNVTENESKCQQNMYSDKAAEEYPLDYLKEKYGYDILITDQRVAPEDADTVINILHRTLNSSKKTIRVGGEDRPAGMVKAVLLKLEYWDLEYAINQYNSQTQKIEKPEAYLLTLLFLAKDQNHLAVSNQVQVDMYGGSSSGAGS